MNPMDSYRRAQDAFDAVLAAVPADGWDTPSACDRWTVRDIVGHVVWGQHLVRHWATGQPYTSRAGAPGAAHPGGLVETDPLGTWRAAREASAATLTGDALGTTMPTGAFGDMPLAGFLSLLITDHLAHAWDIGHGIGVDVRLDADLIDESLAWATRFIGDRRSPDTIGPALSPPADADEQTRWLAYLGRAAWQPVPAAR